MIAFSRLSLLLLLCASLLLPAHAQIQWADDEAESQTDIAFDIQPATSGNLELRFAARDDKNFIALDCAPNTISLRRIANGQDTVLARTTYDWKAQTRVVVQRRSWLLRAIVNNRVVLTTYDDSLNDGRIGTQSSGGWKAGELRVQPVEAIDFADDFTRENGQNGEWKADSGAWQISGSSDNINQNNAQMSANPFGYEISTPNALALTRTGRWFWDNYDAEVSVRPEGVRGEMSLCVYVQDERNYLAFRWNSNPKNARRLVRVVDGKESTLAASDGAWYPRQWYRLRVRTSPEIVEVFLDGEKQFAAPNAWFGQGGIALGANRFTKIAFDDVRVRSHETYRANFADGQMIEANSGWNPRVGNWSAKDGAIVSRAQNGATGSRYLLSGRDDWRDYAISAQGKTGARGAAGVVIGFRDEKNYTVFRWAAAQSALPFRGRRQILRYRDGKVSIESDEALGDLVENDGWARVRLQRRNGALRVYANEKLIAQIADDEGGRCGLWTQGASEVMFRGVEIGFPMTPDAPPHLAAKMEGDALMVGWATSAGEWPARQKSGRAELWNTGEFFGPTTIEMDWQPTVHGKGTVELALRANDEFGSGLVLQFKTVDAKLQAILLRDGKTLAQGAIVFKNEPIPLRVALENDFVAVTAEKQTLLLFADKALPTGTHLAARADVPLNAESLRATSDHRDDYTFVAAPVDWYAPSGKWSVLSRWPCYSDWSFFGGAGLNPVLWNKRVYGGDTIVELYAHNQMDLPKEIGYSHAGDLNVTLCGDGISPASGYAFVLAGWDNSRSRLLKNGKVLAENESENGRFPRAINANLEYHKRWFYLRATARRQTRDGVSGVHLQLSVDDETVLDAFDPDPLPSFETGRVGIWTLDGTMMIARAKIESQKSGGKYLPPALSTFANTLRNSSTDKPDADDTLAPQILNFNGENGALISRTPPPSGENSATWRLTNPTPGGAFAAQWRDSKTGSWTVEENARLSGEIAIPNGTKIDFYAMIDGERFLIETTGAQAPDAAAPTLGKMNLTPTNQKTADGTRWMKMEFALGAALKKRFPGTKSWRIEALQSGALHGERYRWSGFDGNALGAAFAVRGLRLVEK